jgi:hypothetical protein
MRRLLSILMLVVLGLGPTTAAIPANAFSSGIIAGLRAGISGQPDESQLPACCRKNGKHHCSLSAQQALSGHSRETTISTPDCCPCNQQSLDSVDPVHSAILGTNQISSEPLATRIIPPAVQAAAHATIQRTQPKRGPPATQILL